MTKQQDEWGPWIEHDGRGCPVPCGVIVHTLAITYIGTEMEVVSPAVGSANWDWSFFGKRSPEGSIYRKIIRYRIKKPRGMVILEALLQDLPETVE